MLRYCFLHILCFLLLNISKGHGKKYLVKMEDYKNDNVKQQHEVERLGISYVTKKIGFKWEHWWRSLDYI